jgi:hypothetical protein
MLQKMLDVVIIQPSQSDFSSPMMMVYKNDSLWNMCHNYRDLKKITFTDKFHIHVIDELLDELRGHFLY